MKKLTVLVFALAVSVFVIAPVLDAHAADKARVCKHYWGTTPKCGP